MLLETDHILPSLKLPDLIHSNKRNEKLNSGRWKPNEHDKFLEAIIIYGNDWKLVWNKNSPLLCHLVAKIFIKYFYPKVFYQ